jgi:hypothetical protein
MDKFFFLMALSSCMTSQNEIFRISSGEILVCQRYAQQGCGLHLMQCGENNDLELECLADVHYLGRPGHLTKESTETPVTAVNVCEAPVPPKEEGVSPPEFSCSPCKPVPNKVKKKRNHK